nr:uncharacterized protein LOC113808178 [Penaeus vannamei]
MALAPRLVPGVLAAVLVFVTLSSASGRDSRENESGGTPKDRDSQLLIPERNDVFDNGLPGLHFYTHDNMSVVMDCIMAMNAAYRHELLASKWEKVLYTCQTRSGSAHFRSRRAAADPVMQGTDVAALETPGTSVWESRKFPTGGGEAAEEELSHPTLDTLGIRLRRSRYDSDSGRRRPDPSQRSHQEPKPPLARTQPHLPSEERGGQRKGDESKLEPPVTQGWDDYGDLSGVVAQERDYKASSHGHKGPSHSYDHKAPSYKPIPYKGPSYGPYDFQPKGKAKFSKKGKYGDDPVAESQKSKYNRPYYDEPQSYFGGFGGGGTVGYKAHGGGGGYGKGHGGGGGGGGYGKGQEEEEEAMARAMEEEEGLWRPEELWQGGGGGYGKGHMARAMEEEGEEAMARAMEETDTATNTVSSTTNRNIKSQVIKVRTQATDLPRILPRMIIRNQATKPRRPLTKLQRPLMKPRRPLTKLQRPLMKPGALTSSSYEAPAPLTKLQRPLMPVSGYDSPSTSYKGPSSGISYEVLDDPYNTYNAHDDVSLKKVEDSYSHLRAAEGGRPAYIGVTEMLSTNPYESAGEARTVITTRQPKGEGVRGEGPRGTALHSQPSNPFPSAYPTNLKPQNLRPFDNIFGNFDDVFDGSFAGFT